MKQVFAHCAALLFASFALSAPLHAQESAFDPVALWQADPETIFEAEGIDPAALKFQLRVLVIFADRPDDPQFQTQLRFLAEDPSALALRDVMVVVDAERGSSSPLRQQLRPRGFGVVLLEKDGKISLRKPAPWTLREISAQVDKSPLRREEINESLGRR